jgi:hypothetical protein
LDLYMLRSFSSIARVASITLALIALLGTSGPARAQQAEGGAEGRSADIGYKIFDAVLLRPVGAIGVLVGAVYLVPASLMALPDGRENVSDAYDYFLGDSLYDTFRRPLGEE